MSGMEYKQILQENKLYRSELVQLLEQQVKILQENQMYDEAEEAKWLAIGIAEDEKKQGYGYLENARYQPVKGVIA
ncbi:hypothetical protein F6X86_14430 [Enterococcus durans]|uniref:Uncharacterized protein n=2 Tax=Enterococcus TaxID=1350 RepID=A0A5N0YLB8_9ENTE|nr:hypothetical protein F6X86_14430 [Enterococcus durans]KAA9189702.1 hypothetical protein F6X87_14485 [Enterococcus durans]KAA9202496.1 hypothetical protein F6X95_14470 [Enterococcus durans]KAA9214027.1 hypothetical protein F6X97_11330 [Enterococcus durans]TKN13927.1 hypothetical protein DVW83_14080 [Enterococcus sp. VV15]